MSDFQFAKSTAPARAVYVAGIIGVTALIAIGLLALTGGSDRLADRAQNRDIIARAAALSNRGQVGLAQDQFYTGDTPQLAQAALQTNLQTLAESFGIQIDVIRADEIEQIDNMVRLNLTLNGVAPEEELGEFLHGVGTLKPAVIVEQLSLRRARTARSEQGRKIAFQTRLYGMALR
ncbi:GspMb/PilO family protein [Yoonia sp. 2307UL14-13]|uniref:GspMb/PilO family protein n=1 Tax=Yoonia sp. 2307UL14-13 TaxID=3126506 RepID=UPI0030B77744